MISVQELIDELNRVEDKTKSVAVYIDGDFISVKSVEETNVYGGDSCQPTKILLLNYKNK